MQLVLFTRHYPYSSGEEFLEEEIRTAEAVFDRITIVTTQREPLSPGRYIPKNTEVVPVRKGMSGLQRGMYSILCLTRFRFWKELLHAVRTTNYSVATIFQQLLIVENAMAFIRRYRRSWLKNDPETVYYSYWLGTEFAFEGSDWKGLKISRAHGGDCFYSRGYHPYRKEALRNLDFIFPISEAGRRDLLEHYRDVVPGLEQKVVTSHMGIRIPEEENPICQSEEKTIVTCSNMKPLKRLDLMIDALSTIQDIKINWIHFGDGPLREKTMAYAREKLGNMGNIRFDFRGYTPNPEIMDFYRTTPVDLFVNCSDVEGIPVSVMEAMARGIPAVGRKVGGMDELMDSDCGILLPECIEGRDLAAAISQILQMPQEEYRRMRCSARKKIYSEFDAIKNYRILFETVKGCFRK